MEVITCSHQSGRTTEVFRVVIDGWIHEITRITCDVCGQVLGGSSKLIGRK